ncbi:MAG: hypothetical protein UV64_C0007G0040 [Parcubacteria group bacterium GW2011_GWC1_43_11b]|nr:MAG: hypothetical protein UV64_C0007G0040 [Parcubacteria group bacterium GW2011_GWC1_43_11b]
MDVKICDVCLIQGNVTILNSRWLAYGWTKSGIRKLHLCYGHSGTKTPSIEVHSQTVLAADRALRNLGK